MKLPGGLWTAANKGVPADCAACLTRRIAEDFCKMYKFPKKKSFMFNLYGEVSAVALATEWSKRGNYYFGRWTEAGADLGYAFSDDDIKGCEEDLDWLDFACGIEISDPAFPRITEVRAWAPRRG